MRKGFWEGETYLGHLQVLSDPTSSSRIYLTEATHLAHYQETEHSPSETGQRPAPGQCFRPPPHRLLTPWTSCQCSRAFTLLTAACLCSSLTRRPRVETQKGRWPLQTSGYRPCYHLHTTVDRHYTDCPRQTHIPLPLLPACPHKASPPGSPP